MLAQAAADDSLASFEELVSRSRRGRNGVSIVRVGATKKYTSQWEQAFGKKTSKTGGAKQQAKKRPTGNKKADTKKAGKGKAKKS
jgi:hypothetical protein